MALWFGVASVIDRGLLARYCESCSSTITLDPKAKLSRSRVDLPAREPAGFDFATNGGVRALFIEDFKR